MAAWNYHRKGHVDVKAGPLIMVSLLVFSYLGSRFADQLLREVLKYALGVVFVLMGARILLS